MFPQRNALETLTVISCSGTFLSVILHYVTNVSPLSGIWFPIYFFVVFIVSVSFSFKFLQWLLHLSKPLKYDVEGWVKEYPYLSFLGGVLPRIRRRVKKEPREYDTNELSVITTVLERKLVSSWYVPYISQEIGFPFACKQMLDQMIGKTFQICNKIEPKDVYVDICSILISHLKEYRKALKRHEKAPTSTVESLYKKSHPISNPDQKLESADHCTNVLRVILKELVPWELWDTPHSELLVRILSKKLDSFIDNTIADPAWLNDKLLTLLNDKKSADISPEENKVEKTKDEVKEEVNIKEDVTPETKGEKPTVESALSTLITKTTAPILQRAINEEFQEEPNAESEKIQNIVEEVPVTTTEPLDIKSSPVLRQRRGRQGRNEVKIYDRIIEGSVKTWETDIDLQCISLGQDLLASLDGEITLSRLWGQDTETEGSPNPPKSKSPQPLWFGEEDAIDLDLTESPHKEPSPVRKEHSPKPADALLKDLQTTVHQAKTKIGDLQVPRKLSIDVPRKQFSGDEAAGMMEGLLDFGIAGFKKGLRFTGLSDDTQEKSPSHREKGGSTGSGEKISPTEIFTKMKPAEPKEIISTVIQKEDNGNSTAPQLIKQHRVISQDSVPRGKPAPVEFPPPLAPTADSPEPEYEEAADLSTSIAKLRCLLQQRAATSPRSEEIWWEGAVEERGRTQQHPSARPVDPAALADEYDMNSDRNVSPGQTSNNMQRLDKLFQRTVTGVFNSLKTAVGAEGPGADAAPRDWAYVTTSIELSVGGAVARLVGSRRAFTHVDAALDSLHHLAPPPAVKEIVPEDFEEWCCAFGSGWCGGSELAAAAGLARSHVAHRIATLLCADIAEALIDVWLDELCAWLRARTFDAFARMADAHDNSFSKEKEALRPVDVDHTCKVLMENLPKLTLVFGEETVAGAVKLSVSSLSAAPVSRDVCFRALDAAALRFKAAAALRNRSFDAN
ncbi:hypothetical protein ABMA28_003650 [Loxostege sticticalis]|uniref:PXA domain-containing protein n=1 Tax=Loxostege sticticalis TaxID=481309 RepID=A0ABD0SWQ6_LOXSC